MSEWVLLKVVYEETEAEIIVGLLQGGGIEVRLSSAKVQPYPVNVGRMGEIKIFVREENLKEAEKLIGQGQ